MRRAGLPGRHLASLEPAGEPCAVCAQLSFRLSGLTPAVQTGWYGPAATFKRSYWHFDPKGGPGKNLPAVYELAVRVGLQPDGGMQSLDLTTVSFRIPLVVSFAAARCSPAGGAALPVRLLVAGSAGLDQLKGPMNALLTNDMPQATMGELKQQACEHRRVAASEYSTTLYNQEGAWEDRLDTRLQDLYTEDEGEIVITLKQQVRQSLERDLWLGMCV